MIEVNQEFEINYIDASSINAFNRCPAKFMMSRLMGLSKPERKTLAMDYGTDIHEAVPYCYNRNDVDLAIEIFRQKWTARNHEFDDKRNHQCAENTLREFTNSHCEDCPYSIVKLDIKAPTKDTISKNEIPFLVDIGGPLPLAGRIDAPVRWNADNSLWALDYKTSGEVSQRLFNNFENSAAAIAYTIALSQIMEERARGLIVEAIRVSKKNAESQMHLVFIKDHQITDFTNFANLTASRIMLCNEKKQWPTHCTGCAPYGMFGMPGYLCDFMTVCDAPDKNSMMRFYTQSAPWHPFVIDTGDAIDKNIDEVINIEQGEDK